MGNERKIVIGSDGLKRCAVCGEVKERTTDGPLLDRRGTGTDARQRQTGILDRGELMDKQMTFEQSLRGREFEDDAPNYTPRISGIMHVENGTYNFAMSILKSDDGDPASCERHTFTYTNPKAGIGRFIHTYMGDGSPLPSFEGEPEKVELSGDIDAFTNEVWTSLNEDNKVSLFVRYIDIATGEAETRIVNKNV